MTFAEVTNILDTIIVDIIIAIITTTTDISTSVNAFFIFLLMMGFFGLNGLPFIKTFTTIFMRGALAFYSSLRKKEIFILSEDDDDTCR